MSESEDLQRFWQHFNRYKELNDKRVVQLQQALAQSQAQVAKLNEIVSKLHDKEQRSQNLQKLQEYQKGDTYTPSTDPIDRNGVAPSDVQITKIFNMGGKRF